MSGGSSPNHKAKPLSSCEPWGALPGVGWVGARTQRSHVPCLESHWRPGKPFLGATSIPRSHLPATCIFPLTPATAKESPSEPALALGWSWLEGKMKGEGAPWESAAQTRWNNDSAHECHWTGTESAFRAWSQISECRACIPPDCLSSPMDYYSHFREGKWPSIQGLLSLLPTTVPDATILVWILSWLLYSPSSLSSRGSLVPLYFLPWEWYYPHIWGYWYFSQQFCF